MKPTLGWTMLSREEMRQAERLTAGDQETRDEIGFLLNAVEDRIPRVYPWMSEPGGGMVEGWKLLKPDTVFANYVPCGLGLGLQISPPDPESGRQYLLIDCRINNATFNAKKGAIRIGSRSRAERLGRHALGASS